MTRRRPSPPLTAALAIACAILTSGCGSAKSPTAADSADTTTITGSERLGWSQADATDAASYTYRLYVDGTAVPLTGVACGPPAVGARSCTVPLPKLGAGRHALELATVNSSGVESPRSQTLLVTVSGS